MFPATLKVVVEDIFFLYNKKLEAVENIISHTNAQLLS